MRHITLFIKRITTLTVISIYYIFISYIFDMVTIPFHIHTVLLLVLVVTVVFAVVDFGFTYFVFVVFKLNHFRNLRIVNCMICSFC